MRTLDELAAVPEPDGVTLHRMPPLLNPPDGLTITIAGLTGTLDREREWREHYWVLLPVELDLAHDLSWQGPRAYVWPVSTGVYGVTRWQISVLGFIEHESRDAFDAVCDAIEVSSGWPSRTSAS